MESKPSLSHIDKEGKPGMVDISDKKISLRIATATGEIHVGKAIMAQLAKDGYNSKKGSIIQTAIIAATMAVKKTDEIIPLCHQIPLSSIKLDIDPESTYFKISCTVKTNSQTGVEMEALHGVSVAALTIYDMCKALSHTINIANISLQSKSGGKYDYKRDTP